MGSRELKLPLKIEKQKGNELTHKGDLTFLLITILGIAFK